TTRRVDARELHRFEPLVEHPLGRRRALDLAQELERLRRTPAPERALQPPARPPKAQSRAQLVRRRAELHLLHPAAAVIGDAREELGGLAHGTSLMTGAGARSAWRERTTTVPLTRSWSACRRVENACSTRPNPS